MSVTDRFADWIFGGTAVAAGSALAAKWMELRAKRAEARDAARAATDAADATGRHEVRVAETSMVPQLMERIDQLEARERTERGECARQLDQLRRVNGAQAVALVERDAQIAALRTELHAVRTEAAEATLAAADAAHRCDVLADEMRALRATLATGRA